MLSTLTSYAGILGQGTLDTIYMTLASAVIAYLFGLPLGAALALTDAEGPRPVAWLNRVLGALVDLARSVPFIVLLVAAIPLTRLVAGTSIGSTASIVPLSLGALPFVARSVEGSLGEIDRGAIEAARSSGAPIARILFRAMLPECLPSLVRGATTTVTALVGFSAVAGAVGGGGLGDIVVRYGYYQYRGDVIALAILLLLAILRSFKALGDRLARGAER